jgi:hypothetical protein
MAGRTQLQDPNRVGSSEYRAIYETLHDVGAIDDEGRVRPKHLAEAKTIVAEYVRQAHELVLTLKGGG